MHNPHFYGAKPTYCCCIDGILWGG